jgi:hypothetical protein
MRQPLSRPFDHFLKQKVGIIWKPSADCPEAGRRGQGLERLQYSLHGKAGRTSILGKNPWQTPGTFQDGDQEFNNGAKLL